MTASACVLAIDQGETTGWACDVGGRLEWGEVSFARRAHESDGSRWARVTEWVSAKSREVGAGGIVAYEAVTFMPHKRSSAVVAGGIETRILEWAYRNGASCVSVNVQTIKAYAIPKADRRRGAPPVDRSKSAMIAAAANKIAPAPFGSAWNSKSLTEHEADALWLYWYVKEWGRERGWL